MYHGYSYTSPFNYTTETEHTLERIFYLIHTYIPLLKLHHYRKSPTIQIPKFAEPKGNYKPSRTTETYNNPS